MPTHEDRVDDLRSAAYAAGKTMSTSECDEVLRAAHGDFNEALNALGLPAPLSSILTYATTKQAAHTAPIAASSPAPARVVRSSDIEQARWVHNAPTKLPAASPMMIPDSSLEPSRLQTQPSKRRTILSMQMYYVLLALGFAVLLLAGMTALASKRVTGQGSATVPALVVMLAALVCIAGLECSRSKEDKSAWAEEFMIGLVERDDYRYE